MQGCAYDALVGAARMLGAERPDLADEWQARARGLREATLRLNVAGDNVELLSVSPGGRVHYDFRDRDLRGAALEEIAATNVPEAPQAWTVTAVLAIKRLLGAGLWFGDSPAPARAALDAEVMRDVPPARLPRTSTQLRAVYSSVTAPHASGDADRSHTSTP